MCFFRRPVFCTASLCSVLRIFWQNVASLRGIPRDSRELCIALSCRETTRANNSSSWELNPGVCSRGAGAGSLGQIVLCLFLTDCYCEAGRACAQGSMICILGGTHRGYGAMAARLTPDQKVGRSNNSGLICISRRQNLPR